MGRDGTNGANERKDEKIRNLRKPKVVEQQPSSSVLKQTREATVVMTPSMVAKHFPRVAALRPKCRSTPWTTVITSWRRTFRTDLKRVMFPKTHSRITLTYRMSSQPFELGRLDA